MNSKAILGVSLAAVFAVSMIMAQNATADPPYTTLDNGQAVANGNGWMLTADAGGDIPRFADSFINSITIFGYGWLDNTLTGVIATIHPNAGDDSNQNPNAWHLHTVALGVEVNDQGTPETEDDTEHLCVQALGTDHGDGAQGGIKIKDDIMTVKISSQQSGSHGNLVNFASFTADLSGNCASGVEVTVITLNP